MRGINQAAFSMLVGFLLQILGVYIPIDQPIPKILAKEGAHFATAFAVLAIVNKSRAKQNL